MGPIRVVRPVARDRQPGHQRGGGEHGEPDDIERRQRRPVVRNDWITSAAANAAAARAAQVHAVARAQRTARSSHQGTAIRIRASTDPDAHLRSGDPEEVDHEDQGLARGDHAALAPWLPYARCGGITRRRRPPTFIPVTPASQPAMTCP